MLIKYSGKYIEIYFILKLTFPFMYPLNPGEVGESQDLPSLKFQDEQPLGQWLNFKALSCTPTYLNAPIYPFLHINL